MRRMKQSRPLAIRYGALHHNLDGESPYVNGVLVLDGTQIARIAHDGSVPPDTEVIEAACVVPGLINAHVHLEMSGEPKSTETFLITTPVQRTLVAADNARKALQAGVTTVRDLGSTDSISIELRDAIAARKVDGPNVIAAGRIVCMTGGHGWWVGREADGPQDVVKAVREQRRAGADCIKFIATGGVLTKGAVPGLAQLDEAELRAGIVEAHRHDLRCAAHAIGLEGVKNALRAGIDSIEHGHHLDDEALALFASSGAHLVPTLAACTRIVEAGPDAGMPDYVIRKSNALMGDMIRNIGQAHRLGVKIAGGSDAGTPFNYHHEYWYELELMQRQLGMTAREALYAATARGADLLGVDRGRIRAGAVADILLLDRDIDDDPHALRAPRAVIKGGEVCVRSR